MDGFLDFEKRLEKESIVIVESNTLAGLIKNKCFIMIDNSKIKKPSAMKVIKEANLVIEQYEGLDEEILELLGERNG